MLKSKKNIVSVLNLAIFLCSFTLFSFNSFSNNAGSRVTSHTRKQLSEKPVSQADGSSQQLSEKNETETEDGCELQAQSVSLPSFFSYFQFEISEICSYPSVQFFAEQLPNPIYLSVRNFRI